MVCRAPLRRELEVEIGGSRLTINFGLPLRSVAGNSSDTLSLKSACPAPMEALLTAVIIGLIIWAIASSGSGDSSRSTTQSNTGRDQQRRQRRKQSGGRKRKGGGKDTGPSLKVEVRTSTGSRSTPSTEELLKQSQSAWVSPGDSCIIGGRKIPGGIVYVGKGLQPVDGYQAADPALINPDLDISARETDPAGENLDYWPSYSQIPPASRAAYRDWLASGRRNEEYDIGYVFLFFYGLERRILFDAQHDSSAKEELPTLISELEELRDIYGPKNGSFRGYCERLLAYTRQAFGFEEEATSPAYSPDKERYRMSRSEKIALGRLIDSGEPIPAEWVLAWVRSDPEARLRTPGRRCQEEFDTLFRRRYGERFGDGIEVTGGRKTLTVSYRPASGGIGETFNKRIEDAVDIDRIALPSELQAYASDIEEELEDYSRWIGRRDDRTSLAALGQLPYELIPDRAGENARQFVDQIESWMDGENHAVISSDQLLEHWPSKNEEYLTKTEAEALSGFLAGFDLGVEPDVRYTRNPSKRDHLTIFRLPGSDKPPEEPFQSARLLVHLAAAVAGADDEIAPGEEEHIERHLEDSLDLNETDRARLRAHLARRLKHKPTLRGARRRADELSSDQRRQLATFLLTVAGADGYLAGEEITLLEKIYDILGLDEDQVHQDLHSLSARDPGSSDEGPVTVIQADEEETYRVPEDTTTEAESSSSDGVDLDLDRVSAVQDETRDIARVLDNVFSDDEEEKPPSFSIDGLSESHEAFLVDLGDQPEWPRDEFNELAEQHGLMPGFAIEQINDRAFELADEPLLEGEDPIELNPHALEALRS